MYCKIGVGATSCNSLPAQFFITATSACNYFSHEALCCWQNLEPYIFTNQPKIKHLDQSSTATCTIFIFFRLIYSTQKVRQHF